MFTNSLDKKPAYVRPDNIEIKDLTASMFDLNALNYISYNIYKVPKEYEMRPDLIAGAVYNNIIYAELILKFNAISNPFSIQEGDYILIPNLDSITAITAKPGGREVNAAKEIRNSYKYIDPIKIPNTNSSFQNRQLVGGAQDGALPPNIAKEGESQITYRNGRVYFGEGADTCLTNGMTSSEFLTTVIKNKK